MFILSAAWVWTMIATIGGYWALPAALRGWWLGVISAGFLAVLSPESLAVLSALAIIFYAWAGAPAQISGRRLSLLILAAGGVLCFYKTFEALFPAPLIDLDPLTQDFIIPLGLSYYTLRCIHYAVEKYRGNIPPHDFAAFAQYLFYLPTLLAGPIHRFPAFHNDLQRQRWDGHMFAMGLERMLIGYFKITVLANFLFNNMLGLLILEIDKSNQAFAAYLNMVKLSGNIYLQFAGYSDIAIGFGMMMGFKVMENFNFPFLARNISDFWTRWHISLTSWCRDYVYMGTIAVTRSAILAAFAAMLAMGLWHEFSLRFLLWGLYHGAGIMIWQQFQRLKPRLPQSQNDAVIIAWRAFSTLLTLHFVMFGILLATYSALDTTLHEIAKMFGVSS